MLMLAVRTRRGRLGLMWTVLDRAGNSGAKERVALIERYIARFGQESIGLLLGDREFIGTEWLNYRECPISCVSDRCGFNMGYGGTRDDTESRASG